MQLLSTLPHTYFCSSQHMTTLPVDTSLSKQLENTGLWNTWGSVENKVAGHENFVCEDNVQYKIMVLI